MKKIFYLLMVIGFTFTSCSPLEDIYTELDTQGGEVIVGDVTFALSDDDYKDLNKTYGNFNSVDEAKELIPALLSVKYPVWGAGSSALISFNVYAPKLSLKHLYRYTVTTADYDANPATAQYNNFDDVSQIYTFLDIKYPAPVERDLVSLTYEFYNGSTNTLNNGFFYTNGAWEMIQGFTDAEYTLMGEGYSNFSSSDEAAVKVPIYLKDKFKYESKVAGDIEAIMYKLYATDTYDVDGDGRVDDNTTISLIGYYIFDGSSWSVYNNEIVETIKFGNDGTIWVPDNTIKYSLVGADYVFIGDALAATYPSAAGSAGNYSNFDRRVGNSAYWSDDMLVKAFNLLLDNKNPNAAEEQKYVITFAIYNGAAGFESLSLIKTGGVWVLN